MTAVPRLRSPSAGRGVGTAGLAPKIAGVSGPQVAQVISTCF